MTLWVIVVLVMLLNKSQIIQEFYDMCLKQGKGLGRITFERDYPNRYRIPIDVGRPIKPISAWRAEESVEVSDK